MILRLGIWNSALIWQPFAELAEVAEIQESTTLRTRLLQIRFLLEVPILD